MSRTFWKEDDGIVDQIIKIGTILTILVAAHQYYYKVYPVWSKENKLLDVTSQLQSVQKQTEALEAHNVELRNERGQLTAELKEIEKRERELTTGYEKQVAELKESADKMQETFYNERSSLEVGLVKEKTKAQELRLEAITSHLQRLTDKIFQLKLNNIRSGGKESDLNLRRDLLKLVEEYKLNPRSESEKFAVEILEQYALSEIDDGVVDYTMVLGIPIIYQNKQYGKQIIKNLE